MASRFRSISRPVSTLFKQSISKPSSSIPFSSFPIPRSSPSILRPLAQMGALQSLLPLHSAIASARLTSCLGIDSKGSRSLSQELGLSVPR
ncbi:protein NONRESPONDING TO OXYLIPINS 2, mitochondrial-like isoform X2 [Apium graveolens]|uniref:protein NONRESPONDING TO OXYLIPINS 2, mitochondrial-like isoform X2 n=1 Tax=Apium graveolens TaxID=4045 RepID=UPI003D79811B